jgi:quinol monooxygenase YgiN
VPTVIVATLIPKPEFRGEIASALEGLIATVHAEDSGCELYALHENADRFVFVEKWTTDEDIAQHGKNPSLSSFGAAMEGKLISPMDVQVLKPRPAGTPEQGQL